MATSYPNSLSPTYLLGAVNARPTSYTRQGYLGRILLPEKPVYEYQLTWDVVKSENQLGGIYAIAGKPVPGSDILFTQMFADVVNLMASRVIDPQTVMTVREAGQSAVTTTAERAAEMRAKRKIASALEWCDDRIEALVEYLVMNAFQGSITWPPPAIPVNNWEPQYGDASFTVQFPFRSTFIQNASTLTGYAGRQGAHKPWNQADSNPMLDLEVIAEYVTETTGLSMRGAKIVCSTGVLSYLTQNTAFLQRIAGTDRGIDFLDYGLVKDFIRDKLGYSFIEYDAQYTYRTNLDDTTSGPTINAVRFLPRGRMIILPPGEEFGFFATAPHAGPDDAYKPGKYTWSVKDKEPPFEHRIGVGQIGWPVLQRADSVFVFDCWS